MYRASRLPRYAAPFAYDFHIWWVIRNRQVWTGGQVRAQRRGGEKTRPAHRNDEKAVIRSGKRIHELFN
jgi:hypothetical protein